MTDTATVIAPWTDGWDRGTIERRPPSQPVSQGERMREWLYLFKECREAAEILSRTSFVPTAMQGKPAEIATAMLKGWELGLDPLDALASIYVVHGRVGFYAEFMRRRIIQSGHMFRVVESTDNRCVVEATRGDNGETHRATFSKEQAQRAKIDISSYPAEKLVARATSRLCKQAFPDVLSGSLIVEDLLDGVVPTDSARVDPVEAEAPALDTPVQRSPRRRPSGTRKRPAEAAQPQPERSDVDDLLDDKPEPETSVADSETKPAPNPDPTRLNKRMHVLFAKADCTDREDRLIVTQRILDRNNITSSNDLPADEMQRLVDHLGQLERDGQLGQRITDILNEHALLEAEAQEAEQETAP